MRIALLTNGIWPYVIGGMQKHSYFLAKYLARNKVEVVLLHTNQQKEKDPMVLEHFTEEEKKYIKAVLIPQPQSPYFPGHYVYRSWLYSKLIREKAREIGPVDFVIAKSTTAWSFFTKGNLLKAPIAINIHGYEFMQKKANFRSVLEGWMLRWPFVYVNRKADFVFSYGGRITEMIRKLKVPEQKIIELPAGIEKDWIAPAVQPAMGKRKFVFTGRFERRKGVQELQAAISSLVGKYEFEFHFIGPIPEPLQLRLPNVIYHGMVRDKDALQDILQQAHVLICPSYAEGMPNVILEGMANGCAIIATDVGAVRLMVDDSVGWLLPRSGVTEISGAMIAAIEANNDQVDELRRNAHEKVNQHFTWDSIINSTIQAISERIRN
jgi:glycosyltransferase involved in cell wall biosynthesis